MIYLLQILLLKMAYYYWKTFTKFEEGVWFCFSFSVMVNILLRFDLVFCLLDTKNSEWDRVVSSYILRGKNPGQELATTTRPDTWSFSMLQVSCKCFFFQN